MMEPEKLRKADIVTSIIIILFGAWICTEALQMPMKDSWGGVQNVWYVSPALFPLAVGISLVLLGVYLLSIAFKTVGFQAVVRTLRDLAKRKTGTGWISDATMRFFAIVSLFLFFVYMEIPRIDFFLSSLLFLIVFIIMFYLDDEPIFRKLFLCYMVGSLLLLGCFITGIDGVLDKAVPYGTDILTLLFIIAYSLYAALLVKGRDDLKRRYRIGMIVALCVPFVLCPIFKYFLLVPLPAEGMIVALMDALYYSVF